MPWGAALVGWEGSLGEAGLQSQPAGQGLRSLCPTQAQVTGTKGAPGQRWREQDLRAGTARRR